MPPIKLSSEVQSFIYENIDSIGFLEALLVLHSNPSKTWTAASLAQELRNNVASCAQYLKKMNALNLLRKSGEEFQYDDSHSTFQTVINDLAENYRVQRHKLFELIYSPLKKARNFSEAFLLPESGGKKDTDDR